MAPWWGKGRFGGRRRRLPTGDGRHILLLLQARFQFNLAPVVARRGQGGRRHVAALLALMWVWIVTPKGTTGPQGPGDAVVAGAGGEPGHPWGSHRG